MRRLVLALALVAGAAVGGAALAARGRRRLGATARQGPRTGAIEVDADTVVRAVGKVMEKFTPCDDGVRVRPPDSEATVMLTQTREVATGRRRYVRVHVEPRPIGSPGALVHGRAIATLQRTRWGDDVVEQLTQDVVLEPRPSCQWPSTWENALRATLTHELAHTADSGRFARLRRGETSVQDVHTPEGYQAYINSDVEVAANLATVADDLSMLRRHDLDMPPAFLLRARSERWNDLEAQLTPANQRRFYQLAARMRGAAEQRYAEEDRKGAAGWRKRLLVRHVTKRRRTRRAA